MFIYSRTGHHLLSIRTKDNELLYDATWTPRGNIVYTTLSNKVVTVSESLDKYITTHTLMKQPLFLSVSNDGVVFVADSTTGVYQSTDDGISWSCVFNSPGGLYFYQVIKVKTDYNVDFWIMEVNAHQNYSMRAYSVDKKSPNGNVTWRDIKVPMKNGKFIDLSKSILAYDGNMSIFLSDPDNRAVDVLSVIDQCHYQLVSKNHKIYSPRRLAVDKKNLELFVGQGEGVVGVFKLTYRLESRHVCD